MKEGNMMPLSCMSLDAFLRFLLVFCLISMQAIAVSALPVCAEETLKSPGPVYSAYI
jgi:hypothetical protein